MRPKNKLANRKL